MIEFLNNGTSSKYDLEERTANFGELIIGLCREVEKTEITKQIISQLIRSATSIGANYAEANGASSKLDFRNKIYLCKKEAKEAKYWLRLLAKAAPEVISTIDKAGRECQELTLIFSRIASTLNRKSDKLKVE